MANKTKVVLGRGQGSMPINTKPLPEPKTKRQPAGYGDMKAPPMGDFNDSAPAAPGRSYFGGGRNESEPNYGPPVERMPPMMGRMPRGRAEEMRGMPMPGPGGHQGEFNGMPNDVGPDRPGNGDRGMFMDARINPDGSHQGRNANNEFDEWSPSFSGAADARESMLGLDNPRRITRPPSAPSPRSVGKPPQRPARKLKKKKRLMPRKPRVSYKNGGE